MLVGQQDSDTVPNTTCDVSDEPGELHNEPSHVALTIMYSRIAACGVHERSMRDPQTSRKIFFSPSDRW